ncbi:hypothetical protein [Nocardia sp. NPDC005978]|uniref:hypothetical protein n=1 Tax=unclassified Nocardia TaxID=2637762 RepID=UPI0033BB36F5
MRLAHLALLAAAPALVVTLTACGSDSDSADSRTTGASTTITTTTTTAPASATKLVGPSAAPLPPPSPTHPPVTTSPPATTTEPVPTTAPVTTSPVPSPIIDDVNCGPVTDAGGGTRHVIAVGTEAGRVGCTEAIDVASEYAQNISDTDVATIDGWNCNAQPDPAVPSMCAKDGLVIALRAN